MKLTKWFIYTVIIGALPFIVRLLIYTAKKNIDPSYIVNIVDLVTFGLVLHVSQINELDSWKGMSENKKTLFRSISLVFVLCFSALLGLAYEADLDKSGSYDIEAIKRLSIKVTGASLFFVLCVYVGFRKAE